MLEITETRRKINELSEAEGRYPAAAYEFISDTVREAVSRLNSPRHVSAVELLQVFQDYAYECFGPLTETVLNDWNVRTASDVGNLVYSLISIKLLSASPEDQASDFDIDFQLIKTGYSSNCGPSFHSFIVGKVPKID